MSSKQIYFESQSGAALVLALEKKKAVLSSHGMYRAEIDFKNLTVPFIPSDLIYEYVGRLEKTEQENLIIHAGPEVELDGSFVLIGNSKTSAIYSVRGGITRNVLNILTSLPYGEFAILGFMIEVDITSHIQSLSDLDGVLNVLGSKVSWAIGYDELAIVTLLARKQDIVKRLIMDILEKSLSSV